MDTKRAFNPLFWALLAVMLTTRFWFGVRVWRTGERIRGDRAALRREGWGARAVEWAFSLLLVGLAGYLWLGGGTVRTFAFPAPPWVRWGGVAAGVASVGLFAWTHRELGRFWSPYLQLRPGHRLIVTGPYARVRHPMYSAIVGWMIGLGLVAGNWVPFVFATLSATNFILRIRGEEEMMLRRFGDEYRQYMKRTGRLLPV